MDISSDGDLIVTGSADKNLKIWGLDFGDCHKSIFAHADRCAYFSVMMKCCDLMLLLIDQQNVPAMLQCNGCEVCPKYSLCVQCWKRPTFEILGRR